MRDVSNRRRLLVLCLTAALLVVLTPAFAGAAPTLDANLSQPYVPAEISAGKPFTVTGFIDEEAATGPIRLLFYQMVRGSWVLQKTEYAKWSGWTADTAKYLADVSLPYSGLWRIGASYGGNSVYLSDYEYNDVVVAAKADANLSQPNVPARVEADMLFTVTGFVDRDAATGPIKLLFYQRVRGEWVLQQFVYAKWSGWTADTTKYLADVSLPYAGIWRIGASYGGNAVYASDYEYRDIAVWP